jgi:hypothetical protein
LSLNHHLHPLLLAHPEDPLVPGDLRLRAHRLLRVVAESFTVGRPFAATALHTSENGASASSSTSPRKSFVSSVPQPKLTRTRP